MCESQVVVEKLTFPIAKNPEEKSDFMLQELDVQAQAAFF